MRIISQNGMDFPYESIAISYDDGIILARPISDMEKGYLLAKYSTQDKTEKAVQLLHDAYLYVWKIEHGLHIYYGDESFIFQFPQEDEM